MKLTSHYFETQMFKYTLYFVPRHIYTGNCTQNNQ